MIAPGIPYSFGLPVRIGAVLEIHNPSGSCIRTYVKAFEMVNRGKPMDAAPFLLPAQVKKEDIEIGAEIYFLQSNDEST